MARSVIYRKMKLAVRQSLVQARVGSPTKALAILATLAFAGILDLNLAAQGYTWKTLPITTSPSSSLWLSSANLPLAVDSNDDIYFAEINASAIKKETLGNGGTYTASTIEGPSVYSGNNYSQGPLSLDGNGLVWWTGYAIETPPGFGNQACCLGMVIATNPSNSQTTYELPVPSRYVTGYTNGYDWRPGPIGANSSGNMVFAVNTYDSTLWMFIKECQFGNPNQCGWGNNSEIDTVAGFGWEVSADSNNNVYIPTTSPAPEILEEVYSAGSYSRRVISVTGLGSSPLNEAQVDPSGNLYVSDYAHSEIYKLTLNSPGNYTQSTVGSCTNPVGLAVDGENHIFCASANGTIIQFSPHRL